MVRQRAKKPEWGTVRNRRGLITRSAIRRLADWIIRLFQPNKIILFGSYAYGHPTRQSDIDLLVIMPARNEIDKSLQIEESLDPPFALDVLVRSPQNFHWRFEEGDWLLREAVARGKVLHEKVDEGMGSQSRARPGGGQKDSKRKAAPTR